MNNLLSYKTPHTRRRERSGMRPRTAETPKRRRRLSGKHRTAALCRQSGRNPRPVYPNRAGYASPGRGPLKAFGIPAKGLPSNKESVRRAAGRVCRRPTKTLCRQSVGARSKRGGLRRKIFRVFSAVPRPASGRHRRAENAHDPTHRPNPPRPYTRPDPQRRNS